MVCVSQCVLFSDDARFMRIFFRKKQSTHMGGAAHFGGVARFGQWSRLLQLIVVKFTVNKYIDMYVIEG